MMIADTNVMIRAILDDDVRQSPLAQQVLERSSEIILTLPTLCEIAWTLKSHYRASRAELSQTLAGILGDPKIVCDRPAVEAGLALLDDGGDFADGVIAFEGRRLGGSTFVSFDRHACSLLAGTGMRVERLD